MKHLQKLQDQARAASIVHENFLFLVEAEPESRQKEQLRAIAQSLRLLKIKYNNQVLDVSRAEQAPLFDTPKSEIPRAR